MLLLSLKILVMLMMPFMVEMGMILMDFGYGRRTSPMDRYSGYSGSSSSRGHSRRTDYCVLVTGLPRSASWQDLKDHMRKAGDVCCSQVFCDHGGMTGVVDYTNYNDMKYAIRKLDRSEFRNAYSWAYIRVREHDSSQSPYMSRSRSRSRSFSRSSSYSYRTSLQGPNIHVDLCHSLPLDPCL